MEKELIKALVIAEKVGSMKTLTQKNKLTDIMI